MVLVLTFTVYANRPFHIKQWNVGSHLIGHTVGVHLAPFCCEFILLLMGKWGKFDRM